jgi:hypothetical protein
MKQSARERYHNDPFYKNVVDSLTHMISTAQLSPSEMREAAVLASINYEMMHIRQFHIPMTTELHEKLEDLHVMVEATK